MFIFFYIKSVVLYCGSDLGYQVTSFLLWGVKCVSTNELFNALALRVYFMLKVFLMNGLVKHKVFEVDSRDSVTNVCLRDFFSHNTGKVSSQWHSGKCKRN